MSDGIKAKFKIKDLKMRFRLFQAKDMFVNREKSIGLGNSAPAYYPFTQTKIRTYLCVKEVSSFTWANCIRGTISHQIIVGFVEHDSYVGSYKKKPFAIENFGIDKINLKVNGSSYPATAYTPNFDSGDFMELYDDFLRGVGVSELNETIGMTKTEFKNHKMFAILGKYLRKCLKRYVYRKIDGIFFLSNCLFLCVLHLFYIIIFFTSNTKL